jgi:hypothetical protein
MIFFCYCIIALWFYLIAILTWNRAVTMSGKSHCNENNGIEIFFGIVSALTVFAFKTIFS